MLNKSILLFFAALAISQSVFAEEESQEVPMYYPETYYEDLANYRPNNSVNFGTVPNATGAPVVGGSRSHFRCYNPNNYTQQNNQGPSYQRHPSVSNIYPNSAYCQDKSDYEMILSNEVEQLRMENRELSRELYWERIRDIERRERHLERHERHERHIDKKDKGGRKEDRR